MIALISITNYVYILRLSLAVVHANCFVRAGFGKVGGTRSGKPSNGGITQFPPPRHNCPSICYNAGRTGFHSLLTAAAVLGLIQQWDTVAIVGVGLIGGSIGLALRERQLARRVVGIGRRELTLQIAKDVGAIEEGTTDLAEGVAEANLVIVCTPVGQVVGHVRESAAHAPADSLITDVGSTKQQIIEQLADDLARGLRFVGSHPLAGSEKTGPAQAQGNLLSNRLVVVTPCEQNRPEDIETIEQFWESLGASTRRMSPAEHDRALAATSHLPHLAASALAAATPAEWLSIVATGWLDTTRVAAGEVELWTQIFESNAEQVLSALSRLEGSLAAFRTALEQNDREGLSKLLAEAKDRRDAAKT